MVVPGFSFSEYKWRRASSRRLSLLSLETIGSDKLVSKNTSLVNDNTLSLRGQPEQAFHIRSCLDYDYVLTYISQYFTVTDATTVPSIREHNN